MRLLRPLLLLCPVLLVVACSRPDSASPEPAASATETAGAAEPQAATPAAAVGMAEGSVVSMAGSMAAMAEFCGLAGQQTRAQTLANLDKQMKAKGLSTSEIERLFDEGYASTKAKAASDPAKAQADCGPLKQMADPEEIKKWQKAAEEMEAKAKAMGV